jgi:hypothetical protein
MTPPRAPPAPSPPPFPAGPPEGPSLSGRAPQGQGVHGAWVQLL